MDINELKESYQLMQEAEQLINRRNTEAWPLVEKLLELSRKTCDSEKIAEAIYLQAFYYCLVENNYDSSIELCHEALAMSEGDLRNVLHYKLYMTLGNAYQLKGEIFDAQESYMAGLKLLENSGELNPEEKGFLASFYYNVSLLLSSSELSINTTDYLEKAIRIYEEGGSAFKLSKSYVAYAGVLERLKEFDKAIEFLLKAWQIDNKSKDDYSIALSGANLGLLYLRTQKYKDAVQFLENSLAYYEANDMLYETGMVKVGIAETRYAMGDFSEALSVLKEGERIFLQLDNKRELSNIYNLLAKLLEANNKPFEALHYQRMYTDSLKYFFDIEKTKALTRAKKEFESEQKEKETRILKEKNQEIRKYVQRLEISNDELKQFAHVASHDLREPLRAITSYMGLLKRSLKDNASEQQNEFIEYAMSGAKRMELLIIDLLKLAKVDTYVKNERVKLYNVVEEIRLNLDILLKEKNASIIASQLPEMLCDRTQMLQLFQNIISNGIKYNESTKPTITIKCLIKQYDVEILISDNGIGIPVAYRDKVFQIFQRLDVSNKYSGSGIGLTICKKIVNSMNGKISVEDNEGEGSTFKITLPIETLYENETLIKENVVIRRVLINNSKTADVHSEVKQAS